MTSSVNILIVDDVLVNIKVAMNMLQKDRQNYNFSYVTSGQEALDIVKTKEFSLILLDIVMPVMDGFEVCRALKNSPLTADIPVIFLSSNTDIESIAEGFNVGAVDYVTKPFHNVELIARVTTHIQLYRAMKILEENKLDLRNQLDWESPTLYEELDF